MGARAIRLGKIVFRTVSGCINDSYAMGQLLLCFRIWSAAQGLPQVHQK
jgi:hypothetical protein